jgi:hypothetical protein
MFRLLAASPDGALAVQRTTAPAVPGIVAPPLGAELVTAWGSIVPAAPAASAAEEASAQPGACIHRRSIAHGEVQVMRAEDGTYYVVKRQRVFVAPVSVEVTPSPATTEHRALLTLNRLMQTQRVAPVFCELLPACAGGSGDDDGTLSVTMRAYVTDLADWVRGDGRDPVRTCRDKSLFDAPADPAEGWVLTRCAGHALATSPYPSDVRLFNDTLRVAVLQVLVGLAQAQRHCLFSHNDLHAGNVMFEFSARGVSRLLVTGAGAFLLPKRAARARIIDFQHATFDVYDDSDTLAGRVCGARDDVHNGLTLVYDVWRLCTNLVLEILRPYHGKKGG